MSQHHLLVTNDFPPKVGGIQSYLWELWRRLDPSTFSVLTASSHPDAAAFDADFRAEGGSVRRVPGKFLYFPTPRLRRLVAAEAARVGADVVIYDPVVPLGMLADESGSGVQILHGAEVAIPGRLPIVRSMLRRTLEHSEGVIAAGPYPEAEARRVAGVAMPPVLQIPPGVDTKRFQPLAESAKASVRQRLGLRADVPLIVSISRLVPRKGMDTLIEAAGRLASRGVEFQVAIGGTGRDEGRLAKLVAASGAPVTMMGRVADADLPDLVAAADIFVMACRNRWAGLEQEGFGIVFLEAAACGTPAIAGRSGGSADAVIDGVTGVVLGDSKGVVELVRVIHDLLADPGRRATMGEAGRARAVASFDYDVLAHRLGEALGAGWPRAEMSE